jgi:hypothetical protein
MAVLAVCLRGMCGRHSVSAEAVLSVRNRLKVIGVHTAALATQVVKL